MSVTTLKAEDFTTVVSQSGIVLVDCWAPWCGPCKMFGPIFEQTAEQHPDHLFAQLNTDEERQLAGALAIKSIPTLMVFRDGIQLFRQSGALPQAALEQLIAQVEALDMDEVRAKVAEMEKEMAEEQGEGDQDEELEEQGADEPAPDVAAQPGTADSGDGGEAS